ncbi:TIGR04076 family protein [Pseudohaliea sp.]|uniref:TIGR04076 family protein n=1 Tax=Pseudohaliea sp. TaxID=2740289 RepID=UPI0032EE4F34
MSEQTFTLYDLRVETIEGDRPFVCSHEVGSGFEVRGENIHMDAGKPFSLYALAALLPLLPPKQRPLNEFDWMATDHVIACPDPHCGARFRISRIGRQVVRRDDTTVEPLPENNPWKE